VFVIGGPRLLGAVASTESTPAPERGRVRRSETENLPAVVGAV
jgi:hypothetical protein